MAKLFAICAMAQGAPDTSPLVPGVDYKGYVFCDKVNTFGAYLFAGTSAQLVALNALSTVIGIVGVTEDVETRWAELDGVITSPVRTKLNTWLTARGFPTIPAGQSYRTVINAIYKRLNAKFDLNVFDVAD